MRTPNGRSLGRWPAELVVAPRFPRIPKGFRPKAQRLRGSRETLGKHSSIPSTPKRVASQLETAIGATTLWLIIPPLIYPRVGFANRWALGRNAVGVIFGPDQLTQTRIAEVEFARYNPVGFLYATQNSSAESAHQFRDFCVLLDVSFFISGHGLVISVGSIISAGSRQNGYRLGIDLWRISFGLGVSWVQALMVGDNPCRLPWRRSFCIANLRWWDAHWVKSWRSFSWNRRQLRVGGYDYWHTRNLLRSPRFDLRVQ
ncbi:MAG: hypothetical protein JWM68_1492 [Verrucomicrobiales bacterium]|nr:hypothetical protein [Verrucomicrobiales bacterium]